jgi:hypothetical protein
MGPTNAVLHLKADAIQHRNGTDDFLIAEADVWHHLARSVAFISKAIARLHTS